MCDIYIMGGDDGPTATLCENLSIESITRFSSAGAFEGNNWSNLRKISSFIHSFVHKLTSNNLTLPYKRIT